MISAYRENLSACTPVVCLDSFKFQHCFYRMMVWVPENEQPYTIIIVNTCRSWMVMQCIPGGILVCLNFVFSISVKICMCALWFLVSLFEKCALLNRNTLKGKSDFICIFSFFNKIYFHFFPLFELFKLSLFVLWKSIILPRICGFFSQCIFFLSYIPAKTEK